MSGDDHVAPSADPSHDGGAQHTEPGTTPLLRYD